MTRGRWDPESFEAHLASRRKKVVEGVVVEDRLPPDCDACEAGLKVPRSAHGLDCEKRRPADPSRRAGKLGVENLQPRMNKTEAAWGEQLEIRRKVESEIVDIKFEALTFRLADRTRYTPDFSVWFRDGHVEMHEVKGGFIRDDAMVKLKVVAEMFPGFGWRLAQRKRGLWNVKVIGRG